MRKLRVTFAVLGVLLVSGLTAGFFVRARAARVWPSAMPPAQAVAGERGSPEAWAALVAALDRVPPSMGPLSSKALTAEGMPDEDGLALGRAAPEAQAALDRVLSFPSMGAPQFTAKRDPPPLSAALSLVRLRLLRAWSRVADRQLPDASADFAAALRLGHRIERAAGHLVIVMVGGAGSQLATRELRELFASEYEPRFTEAELATLAAALAETTGQPSPVPDGLIAECAWMEDNFRDTARAAKLGGPGGGVKAIGWRSMLPGGFDPERTIALYRARCAQMVEQGRLPFSARKPVELQQLSPRGLLDVGRQLDNPIGRVLLDVAQPNFSRFVDHWDVIEAQRVLLGIEVALLRHHRATGELPATLAALVPRFLASVPRDPFAEGPPAWSREERTLESAGAQLLRRGDLSLDVPPSSLRIVLGAAPAEPPTP